MMTVIHIDSLNRDIELKPYTRGISRAVSDELMSGVSIIANGDGTSSTNIPGVNADRSEELAVRLITGLSTDEMDNITNDEYLTLKKAVNDSNSKKKSTK